MLLVDDLIGVREVAVDVQLEFGLRQLLLDSDAAYWADSELLNDLRLGLDLLLTRGLLLLGHLNQGLLTDGGAVDLLLLSLNIFNK